jgi:hypothetical protein
MHTNKTRHVVKTCRVSTTPSPSKAAAAEELWFQDGVGHAQRGPSDASLSPVKGFLKGFSGFPLEEARGSEKKRARGPENSGLNELLTRHESVSELEQDCSEPKFVAIDKHTINNKNTFLLSQFDKSASRGESPKKLNDDEDKDILSMLSQKQKIDAETSGGLKGSKFIEPMPVVKTPSERPSRTYAAAVAEGVRLHMQPITHSGANSYAGLANDRGTSQTCLPRARTNGLSEPRESQAECKVITHCTWRSQSSEE